MPLFTIKCNKLLPINERKIDLEKDIQNLTEENLDDVFGLKFVKSELALNNLRIDTLAFNEESKSFVIIEFKKDRSFSVVDQGFAYLALMLNNKADFVLEYNESNKEKSIKREDVDWSQSKVIFVANSFTTYQREAISFKDLSFELWEVKKYDNETLLYNKIQADKSSESINKISSSKIVNEVSREVKNYNLDDHFKSNWTQTREVFDQLRERILSIDSRLTESPQKYYIGYKIDNKVVLQLSIFKTGVALNLPRVEPKDLKDPEKIVQYQKDSMKYYNKHVSWVWVKTLGDIDYAVFLAKQVYEKFIGNDNV